MKIAQEQINALKNFQLAQGTLKVKNIIICTKISTERMSLL